MAEARSNKRRRRRACSSTVEPDKKLVSHLANFLKKRKLRQQANRLCGNNAADETTKDNNNNNATITSCTTPPRTLLFPVSATSDDSGNGARAARLEQTITETRHVDTSLTIDAAPSDSAGEEEEDTPTVVFGSQDYLASTLGSDDNGDITILQQQVVNETQCTISSIDAVTSPINNKKEKKRPNRISLSPQQQE